MEKVPEPTNLILSPEGEHFLQLLASFGVIEKGHYEYKKTAADGRHFHGAYFINFRKLTTAQEMALAPFYVRAFERWFADRDDLLIMGVAMGSLMLPKVVQLALYQTYGVEFAYAEKREGILGIFDDQAEKARGKHLLFIEDVCNNGTSASQLRAALEAKQASLNIKGYSLLYGVHRGHTFLSEPDHEVYAMSMISAPALHPDDCPPELEAVPVKPYKK